MSTLLHRIAGLGLALLVVVGVSGCGQRHDEPSSATPTSDKSAMDDTAALRAENSRLAAENEELKATFERVKEYIESPPGYSDEVVLKPEAAASTPLTRAECLRKAKFKYRLALSMCAIQFEFSKDLEQQKKCIREARDAYDDDLAYCNRLPK